MKHILIVDDDMAARTTLRAALEAKGYTCAVAEHGKDALGYLATAPANLVILDHRMPVMDGLEFLHELALRPELRNPPVIFVTGEADHAFETEARRLGAFSVFPKPYDMATLLDDVARVLFPKPA